MSEKPNTDDKLTAGTTAWARALGMTRATLQKRLTDLNGVAPKPKELFSAKVVVAALTNQGDLKAEQIRETRERADKLELHNAEKREELLPREEVEQINHHRFGLMVSLFRSLPTEVASKCNPSDPEHAYRVLDEFLQGRLPVIREAGAVAMVQQTKERQKAKA